MIKISITLKLIEGPDERFHYKKLRINPKVEILLELDSKLAPQVDYCFAKDNIATIFHIHEVMRICLEDIDVDGDGRVHTLRIKHKFDELSNHANNLWKDWERAREGAGKDVATILQRMLGVRFRGGGKWIPHKERDILIIDNNQWAIIDDIKPSSEYLENFGKENLWFSGDTGLRLIKKASLQTIEENKNITDLLANEWRFPTASSWLIWCLNNGNKIDKLPSDQGDYFFYNGIKDNEVPRYYDNNLYDNGPHKDKWWSDKPEGSRVPSFMINGEKWVFGCLWKKIEDLESESKWLNSYPHLFSLDSGNIIDISSISLGLTVDTQVKGLVKEEGADVLVGLEVEKKLREQIFKEHLRALRVILIECGLGKNPSYDDPNCAGLGLSGSVINTPFSDMYFIQKKSGLVIGSPIEESVRKYIYRLNWYGE